MKKLFVALLAVAGLTACFNEEVVRVQDPTAISFEANWVENATRANEAYDPSTTTESLEGFQVWGFMDEVSGKVFEGEKVTGTKGNFSYNNIAYWLPGHTYYFAALAPIDGNWELEPVATDESGKLGAGVVSFENVDGTEDLLYAANVEEAPVALGQPKTVNFTFSHLLSKVKFTFTNGFTNNNMYIDVKNVRIVNAPAAGSIDLAVANWWDNDDWNLTNETVVLAFGDACNMTPWKQTQVAANERLTIPASAEYEYEVQFDVALYVGDVKAYPAGDEDYATKTSKVTGVALEMGKAYNFSATLNASNFTATGEELMPIVFDVVEVKDWVEAGEQTTVLSEDISGLTLVADAVAEDTLKLDGTFDGAGHTLSAKADVDYRVTVGSSTTARLIDAVDNATIQNIKIDGVKSAYEGFGIRGIYTTGNGTVVISGADIRNCAYAFNANHAGVLKVADSTFEGWMSYGQSTTAEFTNVKFIEGTYYAALANNYSSNDNALIRPYNDALFTNCDFQQGFVICFKEIKGDETVTLDQCTCNGVVLTADNYASYITFDGEFAGKVIFK